MIRYEWSPDGRLMGYRRDGPYSPAFAVIISDAFKQDELENMACLDAVLSSDLRQFFPHQPLAVIKSLTLNELKFLVVLS